MNFSDKLTTAIANHQSLLILGLDPNPEMMPSRDKKSSTILINTLEIWLTSIIAQTHDLVCAYKPTLGFYEVLGSEGLALLAQILKAIPSEIPIILDAKHGDLNTSTIFAQTIFEKWQVDAVTLNPYSGQDHAAPFLVYSEHGIFVLCRTSNLGALPLQNYPNSQNPFYLQVVKETQLWGTPEQLGLEVGTTEVEVLQKIREAAPERVILLRSIWGNLDNFQALLRAGLTSNGDGLLIPIPQDLLGQSNLREKVDTLRQQINQERTAIRQDNLSCELWTANVCLLQNHSYQDLILQLYDIGCLLFGNYVQASGATFSYYIDLRQIISKPQVFHKVLTAYADILKTLSFDRIAGIPYGALPTATGLSLLLRHPMIYPRKEVKAHGTRRLIEGVFHAGETVVVVDDILITGNSAIEGAKKLQSSGLIVKDIVVFIDHGRGVKEKVRQQGYNAYSVLTLSEITETLYEAGRINQEQYHCFWEKEAES